MKLSAILSIPHFVMVFFPDRLTATVLTCDSPHITTQPANDTLCSNGGYAYVSIVATGDGLTYQWQVNDGSGFEDIMNFDFIGGCLFDRSETATLNVYYFGYSSPADGFQYRCIVTGTCGVDTSDTVTQTVSNAPYITNQPASITTCDSANASFSLTTSDTTGLTYQWQVDNGGGYTNVTNGGIYSGATTSTLTLTTVLYSMNGYLYHCIVSGACSPVSDAGELTISTLPTTITQQPANDTVCDYDDGYFYVAATGANLNFDWQVNTGGGFVDMSGYDIYFTTVIGPLDANTYFGQLYIVPADTSMNGYQFRCIVSGVCPPIDTSETFILEVKPLPDVSVSASPAAICYSGNSTLTATGAATYTWSPATGLSATTGSSVIATLTATTTYTVTGTTNGCSSSSTIVLNVSQLVVFAGLSKTVCYSASDTLGANPTAVNGIEPYNYIWTTNYGDTVATTANPTIRPTNATIYFITVTDSAGCVASDTVNINVDSALVTTIVSDTSIDINATITLGGSPTVSGGTAPYIYTWSPSTYLSDSTIANPVCIPHYSTVYTLQIQDALGCTLNKKSLVSVYMPYLGTAGNFSILAADSIKVIDSSYVSGKVGAGLYISDTVHATDSIIVGTSVITKAMSDLSNAMSTINSFFYDDPLPSNVSTHNTSLSDSILKSGIYYINGTVSLNDSLVLQGDSTSYIIVNITDSLVVNENSRIICHGVPVGNVMFSIGKDLRVHGSADLNGIYLVSGNVKGDTLDPNILITLGNLFLKAYYGVTGFIANEKNDILPTAYCIGCDNDGSYCAIDYHNCNRLFPSISSGYNARTILPTDYDSVRIFDDEFNNTTLDTGFWHISNWNFEAPSTCSNSNPSNIIFDGSHLNLKGSVTAYEGSLYSQSEITTFNNNKWNNDVPDNNFWSVNFFPGTYIEIRAKLPSGAGYHPALWLYGGTNSTYQEFDINEGFGSDPTKFKTTLWWNPIDVLTGARGSRKYTRPLCGKCSMNFPKTNYDAIDLSNDYHLYGVEWTWYGINLYLDGTLVHTWTEHIPQYPMWLRLGNSIDCSTNWDGGYQIGVTPDSTTLSVDWVKVFGLTPFGDWKTGMVSNAFQINRLPSIPLPTQICKSTHDTSNPLTIPVDWYPETSYLWYSNGFDLYENHHCTVSYNAADTWITTVYAVPNSSSSNKNCNISCTATFPTGNSLSDYVWIYVVNGTPPTPTISYQQDGGSCYFNAYCPNAGVYKYNWDNSGVWTTLNHDNVLYDPQSTETVHLQTENMCLNTSSTASRTIAFPKITYKQGYPDCEQLLKRTIDTVSKAKNIHNEIKISPIPADNFVTVQIHDSSASNGYLQVCSIYGNIIRKINFGLTENESKFQLNTDDISSGLYIIQEFTNNKYVTSLKIVVIHQ